MNIRHQFSGALGVLLLLIVLLGGTLVGNMMGAYWVSALTVLCFTFWVLYLLVGIEKRDTEISVLRAEITLLKK